MYIRMTIFSKDTKEIEVFVPDGLGVCTSAFLPMVSGSIPGGGTFFKCISIYKFKLISSVYSTNIPKFTKIGPSGLDGYVGVLPIDCEGASVVRSLGSAGWRPPSFEKFWVWGVRWGLKNSDS